MNINSILEELESHYTAFDLTRHCEIEDLLKRTISTEDDFCFIVSKCQYRHISSNSFDDRKELDMWPLQIMVFTEFCFYHFVIKDSNIFAQSVSLKSFYQYQYNRIYRSSYIETLLFFENYKCDLWYDCKLKIIPEFLKKLEQSALALNKLTN